MIKTLLKAALIGSLFAASACTTPPPADPSTPAPVDPAPQGSSDVKLVDAAAVFGAVAVGVSIIYIGYFLNELDAAQN